MTLVKRFVPMVRDLTFNTLLALPLVPARVRVAAFRLCGMRIGARTSVYPMCFFGGTDITIGADSFVSYKCVLDNLAPITIGEKCQLAMETMLCTSTHVIGDSSMRSGARADAPIVVGDGCWLGTRVTVLPGVTIGSGCMIAAGAVVTSDCEPNGLYAGIPARRVRDLSEN